MRDASRWVARTRRRLSEFFHRDTVERAMDDEMLHHIECETAERIANGMGEEEARRTALRDFGGIERHQDDARDVRGIRPLDETMRDVSYAARVLRKNPGFTTAVVCTFALGVGCSCAIFSLVSGILLRRLPYANPSELVALWETNPSRGVDRNVVSEKNFAAWRARSRSFAAIAALAPMPTTLDGSPAVRIAGAQVSPAYFRLLGAHPIIGRDFSDSDEAGGGTNVVILSDALWRSRFNADSSIVGRSISMDGTSYSVVGVMPSDFEPPSYGWMTEHPLWVPFGANDGKHDYGRFLHVIARRKANVTIEQARADLAGISEQLAREMESDKGWSTAVVSLDEQIVGDVRKPLVVVFAAVLLLLLMSVVNVANLMVAFTRRRRHEIAVRRALGASPFRLLRQQLAMSGVLGTLGGAVGLVVAVIATRLLVLVMPPDVPRLVGVHVDARVFAFGLATALGSTILFGCASALRGFGPTAQTLHLIAVNRATSRISGARLVTAEVALGLVLSVLAALMIRSLVRLRAVDLGFQTSAVVAGRASLPSNKYTNDAQRKAFFDELLLKARSIPGVTAASIATTRPFACCAPATTVGDAAHPSATPTDALTADVRFVDDSYFATLRIPVLAGATFGRGESPTGPPRVVISRSLATTLWGNANPVGRTLSIQLFGTTKAEVIGVVNDIHLSDARTAVRPALFLSTDRFPSTERDIIVRGSGDGSALLGELRKSLASVDPTVPLYKATTLEAAEGATFAQDRLTTVLLSGFAVLSLLLASVGVYGVLAADVARRRREIGIRLALGARAASVRRMVLGRALGPAMVGIAVGLVVALLLARSMSSLLYGVGVNDPVSFVVVTAVLIAVAILAATIPALRATRVSPLEAIRTD
jgi:putative ABC transport system permease protein